MSSFGYNAESLPRTARSSDARSRSSSVRPSRRQQPLIPPRSDSLQPSQDHAPPTAPPTAPNHASLGPRSRSISYGVDEVAGSTRSAPHPPPSSPSARVTAPSEFPPQHPNVPGCIQTGLPRIDRSGYALVQPKSTSAPTNPAAVRDVHSGRRPSKSGSDLSAKPQPLQNVRNSQNNGSPSSVNSNSQPLEILLPRITLPAVLKVTNGYHGYCEEDSISDGDLFVGETFIDMKTVIAEDGEGKKVVIPANSALLFTPIRAEDDIATYKNVRCEKVSDLISLQNLPLAVKAIKGNVSDQLKQAFPAEEVIFPQNVLKTKGLRGKKVLMALAEDGRELELPSDTVGGFLVNPLESGVTIGNLLAFLQGKLPHKVLVTSSSKGIQRVLTLTGTGSEVTFVMRPLNQSCSPSGLLLFDVPCNWPVEVDLVRGQQEFLASQKSFHIHNIKKRLVPFEDENNVSSLQSVLYKNVTYGKGDYSLRTSIARLTEQPKTGRKSNQPLPQLPVDTPPPAEVTTPTVGRPVTVTCHSPPRYANFGQNSKQYADVTVHSREESSGARLGQSATLPRNLPSRRPSPSKNADSPSSGCLVGSSSTSSTQPSQSVVLPVAGSSSSSRLVIATTHHTLGDYVDMARASQPNPTDDLYEPVKDSRAVSNPGPSSGPGASISSQPQVTAYSTTGLKLASPGGMAPPTATPPVDPYIRALQGENQKLEYAVKMFADRVQELETENSNLKSRLQAMEAHMAQSGSGTGTVLPTGSLALPTLDSPTQSAEEEESLQRKNLAYITKLDDDQVVDLLVAMNLHDYVDAFRREGIDGPLLAELTVDDLKSLGVTSNLHVKKFRILLDGRTSAYQKLSRLAGKSI